MAEILSNQYKSVFSTPKEDIDEVKLTTFNCDNLNDIEITEDKIKEAAKKDESIFCFRSRWHTSSLPKRIYLNELAYPITKIWRTSLDSGNMPEGVAIAIITPILKKMERLHIRGKIIKWTESFLKNRKQIVKVDAALSNAEWVTSGVPQGSVLGPLLFLILVIDIDKDVLHTTFGSFADETRMWDTINATHQATDLQRDLNVIYSWAETNNMSFNGDKFERMRFGNSNKDFTYKTPGGKQIERKEYIKDLGVIFEESTMFNMHIKNLEISAQEEQWSC